ARKGAHLNIGLTYRVVNDGVLRGRHTEKNGFPWFSPAPPTNRKMLNTADPAGSRTLLANIFARHGYFVGLLFILLGGLALNLTPCVYPLIGVTIAYFANEEGGPRRVVGLAIVYVLGIAVTFSIVGFAAPLSGGLF